MRFVRACYSVRTSAASALRSSRALARVRLCSARRSLRLALRRLPPPHRGLSSRRRFSVMPRSASRRRALSASRCFQFGAQPPGQIGDALADRRQLGFRLGGIPGTGGGGTGDCARGMGRHARRRGMHAHRERGESNQAYDGRAHGIRDPKGRKHTSLGAAAILTGPKFSNPPACSDCSSSLVIISFLAGGALVAALAVIAFEIKERIQKFAALSGPPRRLRLMNQGALVIDLRPQEAFEAGHIGEARNVPAADIESQAESLKKWRDRTVITYCDSGVNGAGSPDARETRVHQGVQPRRRAECVGQGQPSPEQGVERRKGQIQVSRPAVVMYVTGWCPYCQRVRALFAKKGLEFTEIDVEDDGKLREEMIARARGDGPSCRSLSAISTSAAATTF